MSEPKPDTGSAMLDRAITSLQNTPDSAGGPSELLARRTSAAMWAEQLRAAQARSRWVMRAAAAIVFGVSAVATGIVLYQHHRMLAVVPTNVDVHPAVDPTPPVPTADPVPDLPVSIQPPVSATASAEVMLTGHVYFDGHAPPQREIDLHGYPLAIASTPGPIYDDSLVVSHDGRLANVVVSITGALPADHEYPSPPPAVMDQRYCTFTPHVVAAMMGQPLVMRNTDRIPHLSHSVNSATAIGFNSPVPGIGVRTIEPFPAVDTFEVRSDLYPWMHAWVRVLDNPFFDVTRNDGSFSIKDLPPGKYTVHAWHETLGELEKEITVTGGEPAVLDLTFEAK